MQVRETPTSNGWYWIRDGFKLFAKSPALWIALVIVWVVLWLAFNLVPFVGSLVMAVLYPLFLAGFMVGCRKLEQGSELEIADLFAGFKTNAKPLMTAGVINMVVQMVIVVLMMLAGFKELPMPAGAQPDLAALQAYASDMLLPALIGMALSIPVTMAMWFVPPLLIFHNMSAIDAIRWSFFACVANVWPFLIYGLVLMGLAIVGMIPLMLGLVILIPVIIASIYTAYRDIFAEGDAIPALNPPENA
jgi:uncharacterized membrane protein